MDSTDLRRVGRYELSLGVGLKAIWDGKHLHEKTQREDCCDGDLAGQDVYNSYSGKGIDRTHASSQFPSLFTPNKESKPSTIWHLKFGRRHPLPHLMMSLAELSAIACRIETHLSTWAS